MATATDSLLSASTRRLALRRRADLSASRHLFQGRPYWIVKEPLGLHYFRFQEEEYALLELLDGRRSLDEIRADFSRQFPGRRLRPQELSRLLGVLHQSGLVVSDAPGQGRQLQLRDDERRRNERLNRFSNLLSIRFRGIDPQRLLNWLYPRVQWFFTPLAVTLGLGLAFSALLLVMVHFETFRARLPTFQQFFTVDNAFWMMLALMMTKVLHEFGHALTCKHFGGECHEMGAMLLVFTPALYCDVSDSWMLPSKWRRAAIGAAGMYVEFIVAAIATFVWWFSQPGLLNQLCLSTIFISSVSTLVFNANPLVRYDGYYILSDLIEVPNLAQKGSTLLSRTLGWWCLGIQPGPNPMLPHRYRKLLGAYAAASAAYRWLMVLSILFFLNAFFKSYGLAVIGQALGWIAIGGLVLRPLWKLAKFFYVPGRWDLVDKRRTLTTLGILATLLLAALFVPLPHRVFGTLQVEPQGAENVFVAVPGSLVQVFVRPGERVEAGTPLARLDNPAVHLALAKLETRRDELRTRLNSLFQLQLGDDENASLEIAEVEKTLAAVEQQLAEKQADLARLNLLAPIAGTLLPPPESPEPAPVEGELTEWHGTPLDRPNLGCYLSTGALVCRVGEPGKLQAALVIDQADIGLVREGQEVELRLDSLPHTTLHGTVRKISHVPLESAPRNLSNKVGGPLATKTDSTGAERPLNTSYQVWVDPLDDPDGVLRIGSCGRARVHVAGEPLASRVARWFSQTFYFQL